MDRAMRNEPGTRPRLGVVGTGYVGLTTGACFAHLGHRVVCGDIDRRKVDLLNAGRIPIVEEGLSGIVDAARQDDLIEFVLGAEAAARDADIVFLCVPTPQGEDGSADLSYIQAAAAQIAPVLRAGAIVVNKSTVPVGSTLAVERVLQRDDVAIVSNPEFLREGTAVHDFLHPDRVVIGSDDASAAAGRVASLYLTACDAPIHGHRSGFGGDDASTPPTRFLATKLSFVERHRCGLRSGRRRRQRRPCWRAWGTDHRIGGRVPAARPGLGRESCFPKDSQARSSRSRRTHGYDFALMRGVVEVNVEQFDLHRSARSPPKVGRTSTDGVRDRRPCARDRLQGWHRRHSASLRRSPSSRSSEASRRQRSQRLRAYDRGRAVVARAATCVAGIDIEPDAYAACRVRCRLSVVVVQPSGTEFAKWLDLDKVAATCVTRTRTSSTCPQPSRSRPGALKRRGLHLSRASEGAEHGPHRHHRWRRLPRLPPLPTNLVEREATTVVCDRQPDPPVNKRQHRDTCSDHGGVRRSSRHDVSEGYVWVRRRRRRGAALREPGLADATICEMPIADAQGRDRSAPTTLLGLAKATARRRTSSPRPREVYGDPQVHPADRGVVLGQRQPGR